MGPQSVLPAEQLLADNSPPIARLPYIVTPLVSLLSETEESLASLTMFTQACVKCVSLSDTDLHRHQMAHVRVDGGGQWCVRIHLGALASCVRGGGWKGIESGRESARRARAGGRERGSERQITK